MNLAALLLMASMSGRASCEETAASPPAIGFGPHPALPSPSEAILPAVHIATAVGWLHDERSGHDARNAPKLVGTAINHRDQNDRLKEMCGGVCAFSQGHLYPWRIKFRRLFIAKSAVRGNGKSKEESHG